MKRASSTVTKAVPVEVAQIAGELEFISGVALTMVAITLVVSGPVGPHCMQLDLGRTDLLTTVALMQGLAVGFVLLRVESLAEEGKI